MTKLIKKTIPWIILAAMFAMLVPGITARISNEEKNKNVVISLAYNDIIGKVSSEKLEDVLKECKDGGINMVSVLEEDINTLVSRGLVTSIKYNVLCHKYDDESITIAQTIAEKCPGVSSDSHIVLVKNPTYKEKFAYMMPLKYTEDEYAKIENVENIDVYILYDGRKALWNYSLGFDTDKLDYLTGMGFEIALVHKLNNYSSTKYIAQIEQIVKKYGIKYLNLKQASDFATDKMSDKHYKEIANIINSNNMTLVVTENTDQLSNHQFYGYQYVFDAVMGSKGTHKIMRSYETYDDSQADATNYMYRVTQFFNSTVDRNIRFITLTQIAAENIPYDECADYTIKAAMAYKDKIEALGYSVNAEPVSFDYSADRYYNAAICAVIMIMCLLLMYQLLSGKSNTKLTVAAVIISVAAFLLTFKMPVGLVSLYPTVYSVVMSCFALTVFLAFVRYFKDKLPFVVLAVCGAAVMLATLMIGAIGMGTMLSGINYYVNNDIFRGIKLSLIVPVVYTAIIYYFVFIKNEKTTLAYDIKRVLLSEIKVYWVLIVGAIGIIGVYYIVRSGNVNSISSIELAMRNTITELFPERPRTKEFLIGYPCLVLFVYYLKHSNIKLIQWIFAVGASILAASVTNSFCHVFTDFSTICMRVVNGLFVGAIVSVAAYVGNLLLVMVFKRLKKLF